MATDLDDLAELGRHAAALRKILSSSDALLGVALGLDESKPVLALGAWVAARARKPHAVATAVRTLLAPLFESRAAHVAILARWDELVENAPSYDLLEATLIDPSCTDHLVNLACMVTREAIDGAVAAMDAANRGMILAPSSITRRDTEAIRELDANTALRKKLQQTAALLDEVMPTARRVIAEANRERRKGFELVRASMGERVDDFAARLVPAAKERRASELWLWQSYVGEPGLAYAYSARGLTDDVYEALAQRAPIEQWRGFTLTEIKDGVLTDQLGFSGALVVSRRLADVVAAADPDAAELMSVTVTGHRRAQYGALHVLRLVAGTIRLERGRLLGSTTRRRFPPILHLGRWPSPVVTDDLRRALEAAAPFPGQFRPLPIDE